MAGQSASASDADTAKRKRSRPIPAETAAGGSPAVSPVDGGSTGIHASSENAALSSLRQLDERLTNELARAAEDYDDAREELARHHDDMDSKVKSLESEGKMLAGRIGGVLDGSAGLDDQRAGFFKRFVDVQKKLRNHRMARRAAYPAVSPEKDGLPGKPLGDAQVGEDDIDGS